MKAKLILAMVGVIGAAGVVAWQPEVVLGCFKPRTPVMPPGEFAADGTPIGANDASAAACATEPFAATVAGTAAGPDTAAAIGRAHV